MDNHQHGATSPNSDRYNDLVEGDWQLVCRVFRWSNISSSIEHEVDRFMEERGLTREGTVFVANHSWGGREWYPTVPKKDLPFFEEEDLNGGWYILREEDVTYLEFVSFSSGSKLIAQRYTRDEDETTFWVIRLSVPIEDGEPYRGSYWKCFYEESGQFLPSASTDFSGVSAAFIRSSGGVRQR